MAVDYFLKLDGIEGESADSKHAKEIPIGSWSWGASNPVSFSGTGGKSSGKVSMGDISVMKSVDKASAKLMELCANGKHIATGVLTCRKSTGDKTPQDYLIVKMTEVYVSSYQISGGGDEPMESVSLAYNEVKLEYKMQDEKGVLKTAGTMGYNLSKAATV